MDVSRIKKLLEDIANGSSTPDAALKELAILPFHDIGFAKSDSHRSLRNGFSETIFCEGKTKDQITRIAEDMASRNENVFATKVSNEILEAISSKFPNSKCDVVSRTFKIINAPIENIAGKVSILCAGTADLPIAEESRQTCQFYGAKVKTYYDVGIAGVHRLVRYRSDLEDSDCAIIVAGMEGALPALAAGLVSTPIIAVPTSVGYGTSFGGISALLTMLNSCAEGVTVVNIDNGFGAACAALRILRRDKKQ